MIGKTQNSTHLSDEEVTSIKVKLPHVDLDSSIIYNRVMVNGVIYSSTSYHRQNVTNDHVFCFRDRENKCIGSARKYLSVCNINCTSCSLPCSNLVIADVLKILPAQFIVDTISGATARHIHCVDHELRYAYTHIVQFVTVCLAYILLQMQSSVFYK